MGGGSAPVVILAKRRTLRTDYSNCLVKLLGEGLTVATTQADLIFPELLPPICWTLEVPVLSELLSPQNISERGRRMFQLSRNYNVKLLAIRRKSERKLIL